MRPYYEPPEWVRGQRLVPTPTQEGVIAFEFEMEGEGVHPELVARRTNWRGTTDGSLRGQSAEFVSRHPASLDTWVRRLELLDDALQGARVTPTTRCSTHVHLNMQTFTYPQIGNFALLWYLVEDFMLEYCHPYRRGNAFALRLQDAESLLEPLLSYLQTRRFESREPRRYLALNYHALAKYGSMEVRCYQGVERPTDIIPWAEMLLEIWHAAQRFQDPLEIVEQFSALSAEGFVSRELPLIWARTVSNRDLVEARLFDSVRRVQEIAYNIPWRLARTGPPRVEGAPRHIRYDTEIVLEAIRAHNRDRN